MGIKKSFDAWCMEVNRIVVNLCGMSLEDLPDCAYRDWYDDNLTPSRAAKRVIRNAKEDM
jgi:hypothetical protein